MLYRVETIEERTVFFEPRFFEAASPEDAEQRAINDTPSDDDIRHVQLDDVRYIITPA